MSIIEQDIARVVSNIDSESIEGKTIFITGGTGLIGKTLIPVLIHMGAEIILLVRNGEKARTLYGNKCKYYTGVVEKLPEVDEEIDYIVHMASTTSSKCFIDNPVETMQTAIQGTKNVLELAKSKNAESVVYLSSMEVYGYQEKGHLIKEDEVYGFDTRVPRNCYPISKLTCEMMCNAYASEYGVPVRTVRLTQTFGVGVDYHDGRVFADFMRSVIEKKDIILHTLGETERCYLYTSDAVAAIIFVLINGKNGEIYNAANPDTYCSIREMAELVASIGNISVEYEIDSVQRGYADTLYSNLDVKKLMEIGWKPQVGLKEMYKRMISAQDEIIE